MQNDTPITEYSFRSGSDRGSRLTLYPGRLVHDGGDVIEHIPIGQLASVRVAFLREQRRVKWAIIFVVVAAILHVVSGPLQHVADVAAQEIAEHAKREKVTGGIPAVLHLSFRAMERGAATLPGIGWLLVIAAGGMAGIYWWGRTTLTLSFGAAEREYMVWGRDPMLIQFADSISSRLAELTG
jgi:hypothetical protein